jgi:ATP synthase protein I
MAAKDPDRKDKENKTVWGSSLESLTLITQLGLTIAIPIVLGAMAGHWLDVKFSTGMIFSIILLFLGIAGGIAGAWHLVTAVIKWKK